MKVDEGLLRRLRQFPDRQFHLIVRVSDEVDDPAERLRQRGIDVRRQFRLTHSVAIRAAGSKAARLTGESWIERIEEDRQVRAL